jgi:HSP20 family protein
VRVPVQRQVATGAIDRLAEQVRSEVRTHDIEHELDELVRLVRPDGEPCRHVVAHLFAFDFGGRPTRLPTARHDVTDEGASRQEREMTPTLPQDPLQLMRDLLGFDPFRAMATVPTALTQQERMFVLDFEVKETPEAYIFKADVPGVDESDLDISVTGNRLVVSGKREAEAENEGDRFYAYERSYGTFTRAFTLPEGADADRISAEMKNGVLTLSIPKRPEQQPKKVEVKAGAQGQVQQQPKAKA